MKIGLNPFEFRAGLKLHNFSVMLRVKCLNPFEFRAGLKPCGSDSVLVLGLNPFEFRAGLKQLAKC